VNEMGKRSLSFLIKEIEKIKNEPLDQQIASVKRITPDIWEDLEKAYVDLLDSSKEVGMLDELTTKVRLEILEYFLNLRKYVLTEERERRKKDKS